MPATSQRDLFARAKKVTPGGVHSPVRALSSVGGQPVFISAARGSQLETTDGRCLTDYCMAFGPMILGHADEQVAAAVAAALGRGWSFGTAETVSLELAELICTRLPFIEQIRFMNSGTEAVMTALRLARGVTGRDKLVKFSGCYHGHSDAMLIRAGSGLADAGVADSAGVPAGVASDTLVAALDDEAGLASLFERHGHEIAAAIIEPLPANFGLLPQRRAFLESLQNLCRQHGALLIFDEVISGFRLGFGGCADSMNLQPDLVTYGKIIGGGFPVGALAGAREIMSQLAPLGPVYQAGTLSANPVAMSAGLASLQRLLETDSYARLEALGAHLENCLQSVHGLQLQRCGSLFWLIPDGNATLPVRRPDQLPAGLRESYAELFKAALAADIYLPPSAYEVGFLSLAHSETQLDRLAELLQTWR